MLNLGIENMAVRRKSVVSPSRRLPRCDWHCFTAEADVRASESDAKSASGLDPTYLYILARSASGW